MEPEFVFRDSAFKHGLTEADIRHVVYTCRYYGQYPERENTYLLLGFDCAANPVEILCNEFGETGLNIFHAMPCQPKYYYLFETGETYD
jgi:hypothetical protein